MYLNILNYKDKKMFFALANRLVGIDGIISDEEIELLETYRDEMNLIEVDFMADFEIDDIADEITDDPIIRKIVLYELITLANIDSNFSEEEENCLNRIVERWGISSQIYEKLKNLTAQLASITNQISEQILSDEG